MYNLLKDYNILILNGGEDKLLKKVLKINKNIEIFRSKYKPINIDEFQNKKLLAIAGIGNPYNFFQLLEENNLKIEKKIIFPDHYTFSKKEIKNIINTAKKNNYKIIMTEKDYYKVKDFRLDNLNFLKVSLEIENLDKLISKIKNIL